MNRKNHIDGGKEQGKLEEVIELYGSTEEQKEALDAWVGSELIFEQYAPECTNSVMQVFEKGEVLLSFENEGNKILTYWEKMQPALYQNEVCGMEYFKKINSNILGV